MRTKLSMQHLTRWLLALLIVLGLNITTVTPAAYASPPTSGCVISWGYGRFAAPVAGLSDVVAIAAGGFFADGQNLALKSDGTVVGWGNDDFGQATPPAGLSDVIAISAGGYHSLALKSDGTLVGWGRNDFGQATPPAGLSDVVAIATGPLHSLALKADGTVVGWGNDDFGRATPPAGLSDVVAIEAGYFHSLALKSDGTLVGWGDYEDAGLSNVVAISLDAFHNLALKSDATVVAWGGYGSDGETNVPADLNNVVAIAAAGSHSLALKSDGTVVWWGNIYSGWPGFTPLSNVIAIAAGYSDNLALTTDCTAPDPTAPTIDITTPATGATYTLGQVVNASYSCADEDGGSGLASCTGNVANGSPIDTSSVGSKSFTVNATDNAGNPSSVIHNYSVVFSTSFGNNFGAPVDAPPMLNSMKAGGSVPVKFNLGGNYGLNILASGYPTSRQVTCDTSAPVDPIETTTTSNSGLTYDPATGQYTYVWKTQKSWAGTCRQFTLRLTDGTDHIALFKFN